MKKELITQRSPKSPIAETFRTLRTNLQFMNSQKDLKTILITSTMPGEGKSWISSNLAVTFAKTRKNTSSSSVWHLSSCLEFSDISI